MCGRGRERGGKTSCSLFTHRRLNRNMKAYTWMMSDSCHARLFLPSLWVFPHSAGRSWVFLTSRRRSFKLPLMQRGRTHELSQSQWGCCACVTLAPTSRPPLSAENVGRFRQPTGFGGEAQNVLRRNEEVAAAAGKDAPPHCSEEYRLWYFFTIALRHTTAPFPFPLQVSRVPPFPLLTFSAVTQTT